MKGLCRAPEWNIFTLKDCTDGKTSSKGLSLR
jgi:hypothetical protein